MSLISAVYKNGEALFALTDAYISTDNPTPPKRELMPLTFGLPLVNGVFADHFSRLALKGLTIGKHHLQLSADGMNIARRVVERIKSEAKKEILSLPDIIESVLSIESRKKISIILTTSIGDAIHIQHHNCRQRTYEDISILYAGSAQWWFDAEVSDILQDHFPHTAFELAQNLMARMIASEVSDIKHFDDRTGGSWQLVRVSNDGIRKLNYTLTLLGRMPDARTSHFSDTFFFHSGAMQHALKKIYLNSNNDYFYHYAIPEFCEASQYHPADPSVSPIFLFERPNFNLTCILAADGEIHAFGGFQHISVRREASGMPNFVHSEYYKNILKLQFGV